MTADTDYRITHSEGLNEIIAYSPLEDQADKKQRIARVSKKKRKGSVGAAPKEPVQNYPDEGSGELDFYA